jgi:hypothetical protein
LVGDYNPIEEFLLGIGKTELEARLTTFRQYYCLQKRHNEDLLERWRVARWEILNHISLSPNIPTSKKPKRVEDILRLPTDKKVRAEKIEVTEEVKDVLKDVLKWD